VEKEIEIASQLRMVRQQQGLTIDQQRLVIRIEGLEKIDARD
jgi:integrase/recombinase XerD